MSEHDQPPFKPGDKFRWNECENQSEPSDAVHDVLNCYARPRRHAEEIVWLVESTNGGVYFADECEPVEAAGEANDELAELRRQLEDLQARMMDSIKVNNALKELLASRNDRVEQLESQLTTVKKQSDEFKLQLETKAQWAHHAIGVLNERIDARDARIAELEAAAGAMRKLLLGYRGWFERSGNITFNQAAEIHQIDQAISSTAGRDYAEKVKALEAERDQLKQERDDWKRLYEIIGEAAKNNPLGLIAALKSKAVVFVDAT